MKLNQRALQRRASTAGLALVMAACGGGGGGAATETPAALPGSVAVIAPAQAEPGSTLALASDLGEGRTGLSFSWDFGDGGSAVQARPVHAYTQPGRYTVTLTVSNSAGQRTTAQAAVQVGRFAMVKDRQCTGADGSGWCWQSPVPDGLRIGDVFFLDAQRGWAVGERGRVWRSGDGGEHWQRLPDLAGHALTRVAFTDADNGWALTDVRAQLARTRDGGRTWQTVTTPDAANSSFQGYGSLLVVNRDSVVALGTSASPPITKRTAAIASITTDGGASWRHPALVPDLVLPDASLWQTGYIDNPYAWVGKSTDLGLTRVSFSGLPWTARITVLNPLDVWGSGTETLGSEYLPFVYRSRDGGLSFERWPLTPPPGVSFFSVEQLALSAQGAGWAISGPTALRTEDGAKTWSRVAVPLGSGDQASQVWPRALDPDSLWAMVGGQLQLTEDGGRTWRALANPDDSSSGYTLQREPGGALRLTSLSAQYRSVDGGRHWWPAPGSLREDLAQTNFVGLVMADAQRGIALDDRGTWFDTADGGRQWLRRAGAAPVCNGASGSLQFTGGGQGWALVHGCLLRSTDSGKTWTPATRPQAMASLTALRLRGALRGWALATDGQAFATADGGQSWQATESKESVWAVASADGSTLWRIEPQDSSRLSRSSDGGTTWVPMPVPAGHVLRGVWFIDARTGWLVGEGGLVLATTDGGQSWQRQDSGSSATLYTVHALDAATVWVAGGRGTVLATATGGR